MSKHLANGKSPEEWVDHFAARGMKISARRLRADARAIGACFIYGKAMILLPEHVDQILDSKGHPNPQRKRVRAPNRPISTTEDALRHLRRARAKRANRPSPGKRKRTGSEK